MNGPAHPAPCQTQTGPPESLTVVIAITISSPMTFPFPRVHVAIAAERLSHLQGRYPHAVALSIMNDVSTTVVGEIGSLKWMDPDRSSSGRDK